MKWTYEKCKEICKKCESIKELRNNYGSAYTLIHRNKWTDLFKNFKPLGSLKDRYIYVYEHTDNTVYIGLTYNPEKRHNDHMQRNQLLINKKDIQTYRVIAGPMDKCLAAEVEVSTIEDYSLQGWTILNKAKGGSLGNQDNVWNFKKVDEIARNCQSRTEMARNHGSAYQWAYRNGKLSEIFSHLNPSLNIERTEEEILEITNRCSSYKEFYTNFKGAYLAGRRLKLLDKIKKLW